MDDGREPLGNYLELGSDGEDAPYLSGASSVEDEANENQLEFDMWEGQFSLAAAVAFEDGRAGVGLLVRRGLFVFASPGGRGQGAQSDKEEKM